MAENNDSWFVYLLKVTGPFGAFSVVTVLALGALGVVLCIAPRSRKVLLLYLLLAQLPILICVVGALRDWSVAHTLEQHSIYPLKASVWAGIWKDIWVMILFGVGCSIPLNVLGLLARRRGGRKGTAATPGA